MIDLKETWITKEGDSIQIAKMGDSHLSNTISMLKRNINESDSEWEPSEYSLESLEQLEQHKALRDLIDSRIEIFLKNK